MWAFKHKPDLPGITISENGELTFELCDDEKDEVQIVMRDFEEKTKDRFFREDELDEIERGFIAWALYTYACNQAALVAYDSTADEAKCHVTNAASAALKAYSIHPLPIYLYDYGFFMGMLTEEEIAKEVFSRFLDLQAQYVPSQVGQLFLKRRDVQDAINFARSHV